MPEIVTCLPALASLRPVLLDQERFQELLLSAMTSVAQGKREESGAIFLRRIADQYLEDRKKAHAEAVRNKTGELYKIISGALHRAYHATAKEFGYSEEDADWMFGIAVLEDEAQTLDATHIG